MTGAERTQWILAHFVAAVALIALAVVFAIALTAPDQDADVPAHVVASRP